MRGRDRCWDCLTYDCLTWLWLPTVWLVTLTFDFDFWLFDFWLTTLFTWLLNYLHFLIFTHSSLPSSLVMPMGTFNSQADSLTLFMTSRGETHRRCLNDVTCLASLWGHVLKPLGSQAHTVTHIFDTVLVEVLSISMGSVMGLAVVWQSLWTSEVRRCPLEHV